VSRSAVLRRRALPAAVGALMTLAGPGAASAAAEEVFTTQAAGAGAGATATTWAPAPATPGAVCMVDSDVNLNPDTTGVVVARSAIDGGSPDDVHPDVHGTLMAMVAAAPHNGWGMVGAAPSVRVVSVRAMRPDTNTFYFDDYRSAILECRRLAPAYDVKVINLSLGGQGVLDAASQQRLESTITQTRLVGFNIVAAAGNQPGAPDIPASYPAVMAIGGADSAGGRCGFSASGPGVDLYAPGCPHDVALPATGQAAWAQGTSQAAALTSAILAQLRALRPDLGPDQAEAMLLAGARSTSAGPHLDAGAGFVAAGLSGALAAGQAAIPTIPAPVPGADRLPPTIAGGGEATMPRPSLDENGEPRRALPRPRVRGLAYRGGAWCSS